MILVTGGTGNVGAELVPAEYVDAFFDFFVTGLSRVCYVRGSPSHVKPAGRAAPGRPQGRRPAGKCVRHLAYATERRRLAVDLDRAPGQAWNALAELFP